MTYIVTPCQQKRLQRKIRQSEAFNVFLKHPDMVPLTTKLNRGLTRSKPLTIQLVLDLFLKMASQKKSIYMSQEWIAKYFGRNWQAVSEILIWLADQGIIFKRQRGVNKTNEYILNPILNHPVVQQQLKPYFSFLKAAALSLLVLMPSYENAGIINLAGTFTELNKIGIYLNYFKHRSYKIRGVPEDERRLNLDPVMRKGNFRDMSTIMQNIMHPTENKTAMQEEKSIKKAFEASWQKNRDPFEATNRVLNRFGNGILPTAEQMANLTLEEYVILQKGYVPASVSSKSFPDMNKKKEIDEARKVPPLSESRPGPEDQPRSTRTSFDFTDFEDDPIRQDEDEFASREDHT